VAVWLRRHCCLTPGARVDRRYEQTTPAICASSLNTYSFRVPQRLLAHDRQHGLFAVTSSPHRTSDIFWNRTSVRSLCRSQRTTVPCICVRSLYRCFRPHPVRLSILVAPRQGRRGFLMSSPAHSTHRIRQPQLCLFVYATGALVPFPLACSRPIFGLATRAH
jgi:hypothetical protein